MATDKKPKLGPMIVQPLEHGSTLPVQSLPVSKSEKEPLERPESMVGADQDAQTKKVRETTRKASLKKQRNAIMRP